MDINSQHILILKPKKITSLKTNNVKTSGNYILKCQRTQIRENLHMAVKNKA